MFPCVEFTRITAMEFPAIFARASSLTDSILPPLPMNQRLLQMPCILSMCRKIAISGGAAFLFSGGQCREIPLLAQGGEYFQFVGERLGGEPLEYELRDALCGPELRRHIAVVAELPGAEHLCEELFPGENVLRGEVEPGGLLVIAGVEKEGTVLVACKKRSLPFLHLGGGLRRNHKNELHSARALCGEDFALYLRVLVAGNQGDFQDQVARESGFDEGPSVIQLVHIWCCHRNLWRGGFFRLTYRK